MEKEFKVLLHDLQDELNCKLLELEKLKQKKQDIMQRFKTASDFEMQDLQSQMEQNLNDFTQLAESIEQLNLKVLELKRKV